MLLSSGPQTDTGPGAQPTPSHLARRLYAILPGMIKRVLGNRTLRASAFLACLALVFFAGYRYVGDSNVGLSRISPALLSAAVLLQLVSTFCAALTWRIATRIATSHSLPWKEAVLHICLNLIAKYLPGKIWGMVARHSLLVEKKISRARAAHALANEQFSYFSTGVLLSFPAIYMAGMSTVPDYPQAVWLVVSLSFLLAPFILFRKKRIWPTTTQFKGYTLLLLASLLQWSAASLSLVFIVFSFSLTPDLTTIIGLASALPAAVIVGMLALIAPGGIGVREGMLVVLCSPLIGTDAALACALVLRAVTTVRDMASGLIAALLMHWSPVK